MALSVFDIVCALILLIFAVRAALRGLVEEASAAASVIFGLLLAGLFFEKGAAFIRERGFITMKILPEVCAFIVIFLIVFIVIKILELIIKDIIVRIKLTALDRVLGFFFGIAEALVVIIAVIFVIKIQPLFDENIVLHGSIFARVLFPAHNLIQNAFTAGAVSRS